MYLNQRIPDLLEMPVWMVHGLYACALTLVKERNKANPIGG